MLRAICAICAMLRATTCTGTVFQMQGAGGDWCGSRTSWDASFFEPPPSVIEHPHEQHGHPILAYSIIYYISNFGG